MNKTERILKENSIKYEIKDGKIYIGGSLGLRDLTSVPEGFLNGTTIGGDLWLGGAKMGQYLFGCITPDRVEKRQAGQRFNNGMKFYTLTAQDKHGVLIEGYIRRLTPIECERLQTLPDNYTQGVSDTQRYKQLGNGWTADVIAHILKGIKENG